MTAKTFRLADRTQNIFINASLVEDQTVRLDIVDSDNDNSTEFSVDKAALIQWCQELIKNIGS